MPFSFTSCHTFKSLNCVSLVSIIPSLFVSYTLKSSKPFVVSLPKSSLWLSILPLLFLSITSNPSSPFNQPVFSLNPSLSLSKYILELFKLIVSMPSPSRSRDKGLLNDNCAWVSNETSKSKTLFAKLPLWTKFCCGICITVDIAESTAVIWGNKSGRIKYTNAAFPVIAFTIAIVCISCVTLSTMGAWVYW